MPLFSIVIANYNYGRFLEDAIKSVLTQSCQDLELIICDAASSDNSVEIIKKYANGLPPNTSYDDWARTLSSQRSDSRAQILTWWCSEKDGGQSDAFNKGFAHARGRFLTWLNADDVLFPGALMAIAKECERHPGCEWFTGSSAYVDSDLRLTRFFCAHRFSAIRAIYGMLMVGGPSSFFTKRLLDSVGGVDESLHFLMDIDLWYKFFLETGARFSRTRTPIFAYRIHADSKMSGADVEDCEANRKSRDRAAAELKLLARRRNLKSGAIRKIATLLTFSPWDKMYSMWKEWSMKGKLVCNA